MTQTAPAVSVHAREFFPSEVDVELWLDLPLPKLALALLLFMPESSTAHIGRSFRYLYKHMGAVHARALFQGNNMLPELTALSAETKQIVMKCILREQNAAIRTLEKGTPYEEAWREQNPGFPVFICKAIFVKTSVGVVCYEYEALIKQLALTKVSSETEQGKEETERLLTIEERALCEKRFSIELILYKEYLRFCKLLE